MILDQQHPNISKDKKCIVTGQCIVAKRYRFYVALFS